MVSKNHLEISCNKGIVQFTSSNKKKVSIQGKLVKNPLRVVKFNNLIQGFKKRLPIFILNINKLEPNKRIPDHLWLEEFQDVFLEELNHLSTKRGLVHDIEIIPKMKYV